MRLPSAVAAVLLVLLAGCSDSEPDTADDETSSVAPSEASSTPAEASEPVEEPTTEEPAAAVYTCTLKGRGQVVVVTPTEVGITIAFDSQDVPTTGTLLYSVTAYDAAGETGVQLGLKYIDGEPIDPFVFDSDADPMQTNIEEPFADDGSAAFTFDDDDLGEAGDVELVSFTAAINIDGDDVATCTPKPTS